MKLPFRFGRTISGLPLVSIFACLAVSAQAATITLNDTDTQNYTPISAAVSGGVDTRTFGSQAVTDTSLIHFLGTADSFGTLTGLTIPVQPLTTGTQLLGQLQITTAGTYTFGSASDDGSRLFIDGILVVNNEGGHGVTNLTNSITLDAGLHEIRVEVVNNGGGGSLAVTYSGPDQPANGAIPSGSLFRAENAGLVSSTVAPHSVVDLGDQIVLTGGAAATINLTGTAFSNAGLTSLDFGVGGTLNIAGTANRDLRFGATTFNGAGTYTINTVPDLALGVVSGSAAAVTLVKQGAGRLILDHTGVTGNDFTGTTIDIQQGIVQVIGSSVAGATNPLGTATVQLNGGTLALDTAVGNVNFANTISLAGAGGTIQAISGPREMSVGSTTAINIGSGQTLNLDTYSGSNTASGAVLVINSALTGDGAVTKTETSAGSGNQPGVAVLAGDSATYSGTLTVEAGTLEGRFSAAGTKALGTGAVVINGGSLSLSGVDAASGVNYTAGNNVQVTANTTVRFGAGLGGGNDGTFAMGSLSTNSGRTITFTSSSGYALAFADTTLGGNTTMNVTTGTVATGNVSESAASNLTKTGAGTLVAGGNSTYTGTTSINGGVLEASAISDSGPSSISTGSVVLNNGTLRYTGTVDAATARSFNANNGGGGAIDVADAGATLTLSGQISGNAASAVRKEGAGTLVLDGTVDNNSLILNATAGVTELNKSVSGGTRAVAGISGIAVGATVRLTGAGDDQIYGGSTAGNLGAVNLTGGTLDLNAKSESISRLTGTGIVTNEGGAATTSILTVGESNGSGAFAGSIRDGAAGGKVALTKVGNGVQTIGFNSDGLDNTYTGGTTISGGTLRLDSTPLTPVSGSQLWLDAADTSTLTTFSGSTVGTWADKSGNGRDATQTNNNFRPTAGANAVVGGLNVVTFDGSNDFLNVDLSFLAGSDYTIFAVEGRNAAVSSYFLGTNNATATSRRLHVGYRTDTSLTLAHWSNDTNYTNSNLAFSGTQEFHQLTFSLDSTVAGKTIAVDGTVVANNSGQKTQLIAADGGTVGRGPTNSVNYYNGGIGEIIIFASNLSEADRLIVQGYLQNKWFGSTTFTAADLLPTDTAVNITASGATLDLNGVNQQIGSLDGVAGSAVTLGTANLTVAIAGSATFAGEISGDGGFVKVGVGTQVLTGISTYAGATHVTGGTLQVGDGTSGSLTGSGAVTASGSGAKLSGSGSIAGSTTIGSGAVLAPGVGDTDTSNQTLTFTAATSTLTVENGGKIQLGITAPTFQATGVFDQGVYGGAESTALAFLQGSGSANLSTWNSATPGDHDFVNLGGGSLSLGTGVGTITVLSNGYGAGQAQLGDVFNLMDWSGLATGSFDPGADFVLPDLSSVGLGWDTSAFTAYGIIVVVPEPSRILLLLSGVGGLMLRRRRR